MDPKAIVKAAKRLALARTASNEMRETWGSEDTFAAHWLTFLVACKGFYTTLEQGSKVSPASKQWFGKIARVRRETPLFQYVFQARDDDLHGLDQITEHVPATLYIEDEQGKIEDISAIKGRKLLMRLTVLGKGVRGEVRVTGQVPMTRLLPVTARGPVTYNPPVEHEGHVFDETAPLQMAHFVIERLTVVMGDAEALA